MSKYTPALPRTDWEQVHCIARSISTARNNFCTSCLVGGESCWFSSVVLNAVFFVRRLDSAFHVERAFSLLGHILTHDRLNIGNETLHHPVVMFADNTDKKRKCEVQ